MGYLQEVGGDWPILVSLSVGEIGPEACGYDQRDNDSCVDTKFGLSMDVRHVLFRSEASTVIISSKSG